MLIFILFLKVLFNSVYATGSKERVELLNYQGLSLPIAIGIEFHHFGFYKMDESLSRYAIERFFRLYCIFRF